LQGTVFNKKRDQTPEAGDGKQAKRNFETRENRKQGVGMQKQREDTNKKKGNLGNWSQTLGSRRNLETGISVHYYQGPKANVSFLFHL
jgi:hypothetical protein